MEVDQTFAWVCSLPCFQLSLTAFQSLESEGLLPYKRELREGFTLDIPQFSPDRSSLVCPRNCADSRLMWGTAH